MSFELITYQSSEPENLEAIALVVARANAARDNVPLRTMPDTADLAEDLQMRLAKPDAWLHVAKLGGSAIGMALGYPLSETTHVQSDSNTEYLALLMVDPDYWGRRVASSLLATITEQALKDKRRQLVLWTGQDKNEHARAIYEHKGFVLSDDTRASYGGLQVKYFLNL